MKLAFTKSLVKLAKENPRIILLTGDLGFQIFDDFITHYGPRYVNVGVAEAQMICAASGLAHTGWRPVTYSIASFATTRCFEQIKLTVAYPGLPVVMVGAGGGYAYGSSGVTHHAGEDIGLMSILPGMTVVAPGDSGEIEELLPQIFKLKGPTYLRIGRGKSTQYEAEESAILGRARLLADGQDVAIATTGEVAAEVTLALKILASKNCYPMAFQFHTVKPLDFDTLEKLSKKVRTIIVVEEHIPNGGLASAIKNWMGERDNHRVKVRTLSVPDEFVLGSPSQNEVRTRYGISAEAIAAAVEKSSNASIQNIISLSRVNRGK